MAKGDSSIIEAGRRPGTVTKRWSALLGVIAAKNRDRPSPAAHTHAATRLDERRLTGQVDLAPQRADGRVHDVADQLRCPFVQMGLDFGARHDLPVPTGQILQQRVFAGPKLTGLPRTVTLRVEVFSSNGPMRIIGSF
jgi:hypothetical protein